MGKPASMNPMNGFAGGNGGTGTGGASKRRGADWYSHKVVTTTAGAVDATNSDQPTESRLTVAKTAATVGRYTVTVPDKYRKLLAVLVTIIGPNTANYGANTTGMDWLIRANDVDGNNLDGTFELQFIQTSYADAELPDGTSFILTLCAARGV